MEIASTVEKLLSGLERRADLLGGIFGFFGTMNYDISFALGEINDLLWRPKFPDLPGIAWNLKQGPLAESILAAVAGYALKEADAGILGRLGRFMEKFGVGALLGNVVAALIRASHYVGSSTSSTSSTSTSSYVYK